MKQLILVTIALMLVLYSNAQGNKEKSKAKQNDAQVSVQAASADNRVSAGNNKNSIRNVPKPVANSFNDEYPRATNVEWSKDRGNWTASFNVRVHRSVATYHANGKRIDTRTPIPLAEAPKPVEVFQQKAGTIFKIGKIFQVEVPGGSSLYQVESTTGKVVYLDKDGAAVSYIPQ